MANPRGPGLERGDRDPSTSARRAGHPGGVGGARNGSYTAAGRIAGFITWRATFEYQLTDGGFHSWMPTPSRGFQVGGLHVIDDAPGSCTVVHYEQYHLPFALRSIAFAWRLYVTRSMNTELERIALLAQPTPGQRSNAA